MRKLDKIKKESLKSLEEFLHRKLTDDERLMYEFGYSAGRIDVIFNEEFKIVKR
jgi:hypothetical protein